MTIKSVLKILAANELDISILIYAPNCNQNRLRSYFQSLIAINLATSRRLLFKLSSFSNLASSTIAISSVSYSSSSSSSGTLDLTL